GDRVPGGVARGEAPAFRRKERSMSTPISKSKDIEDMTITEASAPGATMTPEEKAEALRKRREVPFPALPGAFFVYGLTALGKLEDDLNEIDPGWSERREGTVLFHLERQLIGGNPKMV